MLLNGFDGNESHIRPTDSLTNGFGIIGIVLAALAVRDNEFGIHQLDGMAEFADFSSPVLGRGAGFNADQTGFKLSEERQHFRAAQGLAFDGFAVYVDRVKYEDILCNIKTDSSNLVHGFLLTL